MVRQYPATKNAIVDLNKVMSSCEWYGRDRFTAQLQKDVRKHLLHAGTASRVNERSIVAL